MLSGCSRDICINPYCKRNPNFQIKSQGEALRESLQLMKKYSDGNIGDIRQVICDPSLQENTWTTIQASNIEECLSSAFLVAIAKSPYALSLSFLKDQKLVGRQDDLG